MKNWQKSRNYRRLKDENDKTIAHIITVDGVNVEVTEEVFLAYAQADRRERYLLEDAKKGKKLSLDQLIQDGMPLSIEAVPSSEDGYIVQEDAQTRLEQKRRLREILPTLYEDEQDLIRALYVQGLSVREYAKQLGVYHRTVIYRRDKLLEKLRRKISL